MTELPLVELARYYLTVNLSTKLGLVNGCEVQLIGISMPVNKINIDKYSYNMP